MPCITLEHGRPPTLKIEYWQKEHNTRDFVVPTCWFLYFQLEDVGCNRNMIALPTYFFRTANYIESWILKRLDAATV